MNIMSPVAVKPLDEATWAGAVDRTSRGRRLSAQPRCVGDHRAPDLKRKLFVEGNNL